MPKGKKNKGKFEHRRTEQPYESDEDAGIDMTIDNCSETSGQSDLKSIHDEADDIQEKFEEKVMEVIDALSARSNAARASALVSLRSALQRRHLTTLLCNQRATLADHVTKALRRGKDGERRAAAAIAPLLALQIGEDGAEEFVREVRPALTAAATDKSASVEARTECCSSLSVLCYLLEEDLTEIIEVMRVYETIFSGSYLKGDGSVKVTGAAVEEGCLHAAALEGWALLLPLLAPAHAAALLAAQPPGAARLAQLLEACSLELEGRALLLPLLAPAHAAALLAAQPPGAARLAQLLEACSLEVSTATAGGPGAAAAAAGARARRRAAGRAAARRREARAAAGGLQSGGQYRNSWRAGRCCCRCWRPRTPPRCWPRSRPAPRGSRSCWRLAVWRSVPQQLEGRALLLPLLAPAHAAALLAAQPPGAARLAQLLEACSLEVSTATAGGPGAAAAAAGARARRRAAGRAAARRREARAAAGGLQSGGASVGGRRARHRTRTYNGPRERGRGAALRLARDRSAPTTGQGLAQVQSQAGPEAAASHLQGHIEVLRGGRSAQPVCPRGLGDGGVLLVGLPGRVRGARRQPGLGAADHGAALRAAARGARARRPAAGARRAAEETQQAAAAPAERGGVQGAHARAQQEPRQALRRARHVAARHACQSGLRIANLFQHTPVTFFN